MKKTYTKDEIRRIYYRLGLTNWGEFNYELNKTWVRRNKRKGTSRSKRKK